MSTTTTNADPFGIGTTTPQFRLDLPTTRVHLSPIPNWPLVVSGRATTSDWYTAGTAWRVGGGSAGVRYDPNAETTIAVTGAEVYTDRWFVPAKPVSFSWRMRRPPSTLLYW